MKTPYNERYPRIRVDWGDALTIPHFYGRKEEQTLLAQWVMQKNCRVVSVLGMGGIGKSALAINVMHELVRGTAQEQGAVPATACPFEVVIFRSLRDAPTCSELLDDCLQVLSPQASEALLAGRRQAQESEAVGTGLAPVRRPTYPTEQRLRLLIEHLRKTRVLIVLDNLECLLEERNIRGHFRPGFEEYALLLHRVVETVHQSCLLITSREKPAELRQLAGRYTSVRALRLTGLDVSACQQFFVEKELVGTLSEQENLIKAYSGNPLALKIVAETIIDLFGGQIGRFLAEGQVIFGSINDLLDEQFARLSFLEQAVLYWLAILREPGTLDELLALLLHPLPRRQALLDAIDSLRRRSLIECGKRLGSFTLQSVVLEYVTALLVAETCSEIKQGLLGRLIQYGLSQATAREYVRQSQERLLVAPLLATLQIASERGQGPPLRRADGETSPVEMQLLGLLDELRTQTNDAQGYGPANLITLLRLLRGDLKELNLSQLSIRGVYLQNVEMQGASLAFAQIRDTVFTQAVRGLWTVAMSLDGKCWAVGSLYGQVHVWEGVQSQTLRLSLSAHTDVVQALAFSLDRQLLASGGQDGTIKLWDIGARLGASPNPTDGRSRGAAPCGALLWTGWQECPLSLAFSPDGRVLASGGVDATVRLWETSSHGACPRGTNLQTLAHPSYVSAVAFSPNGRLLASGCINGQIRLWEWQKGSTTTWVEVLSLQSNWVLSLAFAPDGRMLASTSKGDQYVYLWEVESGQLLHTLPGFTDKSRCVAWSPDGRTLAYSHPDKAICVFDVEEGRCRAVLHGHNADIYGVAFTPDGSNLFSGSADSTLRVWDALNGRCVRVTQGYGAAFSRIDWSPDGRHLVSGETDGPVTIWNLGDETPRRVLREHNWIVMGVGWSPDGRYLSSCGVDGVLCLWNPASHNLVQRFENSRVVLLSMAWSPNGSHLACGTYGQGIQLWDATMRSLRFIGQTLQTAFYSVAWSPNGMQLASGGEDGCVYLWESAASTGQEQVEAEKVQTPPPTKLLGHQGRIMSVVWSPDGTWLAASGGSKGNEQLSMWNAKSGERVQVFEGHPGMICALAWCRRRDGTSPHPGTDPRGYQLISGGSDGMLRWWDIQTGQCVRTQAAHQGTLQSLRVSPNGMQLASCGDDGAIMVWHLESSGQAQEDRDRRDSGLPLSASLRIPTALPLLQTLRRDRPYERLDITGIRGLNEEQKASLQALGAIDEQCL